MPDLSDVQVIIKTSYPGRAPQIVENRHLSTYHHHAVRTAQNRAWFFQFGDSYVYVILKTAPICTGPVPACWNI
ncbi:hypothetical protein [Klebsiella pneumoniae]|uniref:hypothetical protein n=1 Tax=Klebsiella pneumoniae TaxID=573 RepID=UPI00396F6312